MTNKASDPEVRRVVQRVLRSIPNDRRVEKADFEAILGEVMACVHEKTGADAQQLREVLQKIMSDLAGEYGLRPERERTWEVLIAYLYGKFMKGLSPKKGPEVH